MFWKKKKDSADKLLGRVEEMASKFLVKQSGGGGFILVHQVGDVEAEGPGEMRGPMDARAIPNAPPEETYLDAPRRRLVRPQSIYTVYEHERGAVVDFGRGEAIIVEDPNATPAETFLRLVRYLVGGEEISTIE